MDKSYSRKMRSSNCNFCYIRDNYQRLYIMFLQDYLTESAWLISKAGETVEWVTPLGLPIVQPYHKKSLKLITHGGRNVYHEERHSQAEWVLAAICNCIDTSFNLNILCSSSGISVLIHVVLLHCGSYIVKIYNLKSTCMKSDLWLQWMNSWISFCVYH